MTINIATHAVVIVSGGKKADLETPIAQLDWARMIWNVSKPDQSMQELRDLIEENEKIIVILRSGHPAARRDMARVARKRGMVPYVITVGTHEEIDLDDEKIEQVFEANGQTDIRIVPLRPDRRDDAGPFDIIGDIHGCYDELMLLLHKLGHARDYGDGNGYTLKAHPEGRRIILLGDLTDRGPENRKVVEVARRLESEFQAIIICGNHDDKFARWLEGRKVKINPNAGIAGTVAEYEDMPEDERKVLGKWLRTRGDHYLLDGGRLAVAHAGIDESNQGRITNEARAFALYGPVTGGIDEDGHPEVRDWTSEYNGEAVVVHGHVVVREPTITGNVVAIDTGAVFGGKLTAYRWPERTFVSVPALKTYWQGSGRANLADAA